MQMVAQSSFTTVKTEGAILPADLLQRIAGGMADGLQPADYHLAPDERLNEAINRAWNRCRGVWQSFHEQRQVLPEADLGTSLTRDRWLLILFQELGYGRLTFQRHIELADGALYPISHQWGAHTPIHLVSFRQELERRDPAIKRSPHSLLQEFLNRSEHHLWGFVSNGLTLQILRDNISLTRAAYLEFDLEKMMGEQIYADFALLWLICHQSRVEVGADRDAPLTPANCWLESWSQQAAQAGTRALDALRRGVQEAITALGRGFLAQRGNERLKQRLRAGVLSKEEYFRQLLRLVYRLIFLFVAEDRNLLLLPDADEQARTRYTAYYSLGRLRTLAAARRGGPHPDLYRTLRRVFFLLRTGYPDLGLPALGSFLFSDRSTPVLDELDIANSELLSAIRALASIVEGQVTRPVDYKNLGAEELGSVYESLLEYHPNLNLEAATFTLELAAGSERKTTGSYYTPTSLIISLLESALEPVVADRLRNQADAESAATALLAIKVVDPACGSGHFLIAAAHRLATHLARLRTGDDEPSPAARREALRAVVHHCIHGVDINEMAVELCKVGLWVETLKFCLLTLTAVERPSTKADFVFFARQASHLKEDFRHFVLTAAEIELLNPNTRTCPIFRSERDAELSKAIYRRIPVLIKEGQPEENPWGINFLRMFDMSNDSGLFRTKEQLEQEGWQLFGNHFIKRNMTYLPLYEGKMFHHFDHRFGTYEGQTQAQANQGKLPELDCTHHADPSLFSLPKYWIPEAEFKKKETEQDANWFIAFRDITSAVVLRTAIFSLLPKVPVGNNAPLILLPDDFIFEGKLLVASLSSFAFDFVSRFSVGGTHMNFFILKQLPVLPPATYHQPCSWQASHVTYYAWLLPRVLELTYTAYDLRAFAQDCGYHGPPFRWDEERRFLLRCEVDAAYFHLYAIARDDVDYIMETFPIVRRKDEAAFGDYRTKRLILAIYDAMAAAIQTGHPYQTLLDPPPAHPSAAHAWDESQLGPYRAPSLWWEKDDKTEGQDDKVTAAGREGSGDRAASGSATHLPATKPAAVEPKAAQALQPALLAVLPPPSGPRARRLQQVMALGKDGSATATRGLVAFLADEDTNIRWLAGSSLVQRASHDVVAAMMSFLTGVEAAQISAARPEIQRVLGLIAETVEDETVRAAARQVLDEL